MIAVDKSGLLCKLEMLNVDYLAVYAVVVALPLSIDHIFL